MLAQARFLRERSAARTLVQAAVMKCRASLDETIILFRSHLQGAPLGAAINQRVGVISHSVIIFPDNSHVKDEMFSEPRCMSHDAFRHCFQIAAALQRPRFNAADSSFCSVAFRALAKVRYLFQRHATRSVIHRRRG